MYRREQVKEVQMNWDRIAGNWKQLAGVAKEQWGKLTDDDLLKIAGKREHLEGKLQERYGYGKDKIREEVEDWMSRVSPVEHTKSAAMRHKDASATQHKEAGGMQHKATGAMQHKDASAMPPKATGASQHKGTGTAPHKGSR